MARHISRSGAEALLKIWIGNAADELKNPAECSFNGEIYITGRLLRELRYHGGRLIPSGVRVDWFFEEREKEKGEKKEKEAFIIARAHRLLPLTRMINDVINAGGRWVAPYGANVPAKKCFPAVSTSILRLNILLQPPAAWSQQNYGAKLKLDECTALGSVKCLVKCETGENVMLRDVNGDGLCCLIFTMILKSRFLKSRSWPWKIMVMVFVPSSCPYFNKETFNVSRKSHGIKYKQETMYISYNPFISHV